MKGRICCNCKEEKEADQFYVSEGRLSRYCKICHKKHCTRVQTERKKALIEYKGGYCVHCGIESNDDNYVIFDFHHLNPEEKEMSVKVSNRSLETLKKEADKCILLCSNCHRLEHRRISSYILTG